MLPAGMRLASGTGYEPAAAALFPTAAVLSGVLCAECHLVLVRKCPMFSHPQSGLPGHTTGKDSRAAVTYGSNTAKVSSRLHLK